MNPTLARTLTALLRRFGPELLGNVRRLDGLLRDLHPDRPLEVSVLVEVVECGVVAELQTMEFRPRPGPELNRLVAHLVDRSGIAAPHARLAVRTWAALLLPVAPPQGAAAPDRAPRPSRVSERSGSLDAVMRGAMERRPEP